VPASVNASITLESHRKHTHPTPMNTNPCHHIPAINRPLGHNPTAMRGTNHLYGNCSDSFARLDSDIVDYLYSKSHSRVARRGLVVRPPLLAQWLSHSLGFPTGAVTLNSIPYFRYRNLVSPVRGGSLGDPLKLPKCPLNRNFKSKIY
jgi:hypothetical protein